jgi:hypothetical protein
VPPNIRVHRVSNDGQVEIHTGEPLVHDLSPFEIEIAVAESKRYKLTGSDRTLAELIQAGGKTVLSEIHEFINSIWNKEELPDQWKESIIILIKKKGDKTDHSSYHGI